MLCPNVNWIYHTGVKPFKTRATRSYTVNMKQGYLCDVTYGSPGDIQYTKKSKTQTDLNCQCNWMIFILCKKFSQLSTRDAQQTKLQSSWSWIFHLVESIHRGRLPEEYVHSVDISGVETNWVTRLGSYILRERKKINGSVVYLLLCPLLSWLFWWGTLEQLEIELGIVPLMLPYKVKTLIQDSYPWMGTSSEEIVYTAKILMICDKVYYCTVTTLVTCRRTLSKRNLI